MKKLGTLGRVPDIYTNIYHHTCGLYNGCIGQDGVIVREQLLGYPAKGTQHFPLILPDRDSRNHISGIFTWLLELLPSTRYICGKRGRSHG